MDKKLLVSVCNCGVGFVGYVAVMEWSRVHEERPRASTSGGQSEGSEGAVAAAVAVAGDFDILPERAKSEATLLHVRHGLPSGPRTTPLDSFFGATVSASCFSGVSMGPGAIVPGHDCLMWEESDGVALR